MSRLLHIRPYGFEVGSVHKYGEMFERVAEVENVTLKEIRDPSLDRIVASKEFDMGLIGGDWWPHWESFAKAGKPYILVEHDIHTMRIAGSRVNERAMVEGASAVLFTSEDHRDYCSMLYDLPPSAVVHLRPLAGALDFEPLPKRKGKHLVYAGGLTPRASAEGAYGYRAYHDIFTAFIDAGWTVHLYPCYLVKPEMTREYEALGCVIHDAVPEDDLPRELSQYTAGLQSYARHGDMDAFMYTQTCRPNKAWSYLAAGIPTIGYLGGNSMALYDGKWGVVLDSLDDIKGLKLPKIGVKMRREQVMDGDESVFADLVERAVASPRTPSLPVVKRPEKPIVYPVKLGKDVTLDGETLVKGTMVDRPTALKLKAAGQLTDERIR